MTVYENIRFPLKVRKVDAASHDARVRKAAAMVELGDLLARRPRELSWRPAPACGAGARHCARAGGVPHGEPLSNLDAKLRVSTRAQIKNLQHELKVTTIYVTHDQIEAMTLADRVVVMNKGARSSRSAPRRTSMTGQPTHSWPASSAPLAMNLVNGDMMPAFSQRRRRALPACRHA